jgi:molybdopterin/thiamine biosynthesis adenylyltransferase
MADRYARHRAIEGFSQEDLQSSRVAVIGAGAIGNEVVKNLCLLGIGNIDVYDFDTVELHNLTRSVLLREADVGRGKAASVAQRAAELDPAVSIQAIHGDVWQTLSFEALRRYRVVIGALDNFEARLRVNQLCWIAGVDWINAAIDSRYVTVESFPLGSAPISSGPDGGIDGIDGGGDGAENRIMVEGSASADGSRVRSGEEQPACYECALPASVYQRIAERYSCGGLQRAAARQRIMPTTAITASLAGAQAVNQALRMPQRAQRWLLDSHSGLATLARLRRAPFCPCCADQTRKAAIAAPAAATAVAVDAAARAAGAGILRLSDPIIWTCDCANCGATPATRAVELKRAATVPDSVTLCAQCATQAIRVQIRDEFEPGELSERFPADAIVPARFVLADDTCLDLQAVAASGAIVDTESSPMKDLTMENQDER